MVPIGIASVDASFLLNPYILGFVIITMLGFGLVGFFLFIRPYMLYRKYPTVQVEADDEFLYIHANKEAKIPLDSLTEATVYTNLPFLLQKEFVAEILIHMFSEEYGDIVLEIPEHGTFKLRFVTQVQSTADDLTRFISNTVNSRR